MRAENGRMGEWGSGSKEDGSPALLVSLSPFPVYTSFSRTFALAKSISATTTTMNNTTVPAL